MSRSRPIQRTPVTRYFKWSGGSDKGYVSYWDKEAEEEVAMDFPFTFLPLDELHTTAGYHESDSSSIYGNEVKDLKNKLYVRTSQGVKLSGLYEDIKDQLKAMGGKYAKAIYIGYTNEANELVIGKLLVTGSSLTAWINFAKTCNPFDYEVSITGNEAAKKGATKYFTPVFARENPSQEDSDKADELDKQLQNYFDTSLNKPVEETAVATDTILDDDDEEEKPIDLSDIPF